MTNEDLKDFPLKQLEKDLMETLEKDLTVAAHLINNTAKKLCAVDKGYLRNSIHPTKIDRFNWEVGTNVSANPDVDNEGYATYVEFGTSKQRAQPFMRPAYAKGVKRLDRDMKKSIDRIMKKYFG